MKKIIELAKKDCNARECGLTSDLYELDRAIGERAQLEQKAVRELCEQIGYGNVMDIASREWQAHLEKCGLPTEGAHKPAIVTDNHVYANDKVYVSIDKACKWLRQHAISVINIEAFRKAMED